MQSAGLTGRVLLPGFVRHLPVELGGASIFALTSRFEAFGMVIVEAQRSGVPVVAFDCPTGPRTIIEDGVDGFLVPPGNTAAFADKLAALVHDPGLRARMGRAGRIRARRFDSAVIATNWLGLFDNLRVGVGAPATSHDGFVNASTPGRPG